MKAGQSASCRVVTEEVRSGSRPPTSLMPALEQNVPGGTVSRFVSEVLLMPKELEEKLKRQARKKGLGKKRAAAYVYGTMRKTGWRPSRGKRKKKK